MMKRTIFLAVFVFVSVGSFAQRTKAAHKKVHKTVGHKTVGAPAVVVNSPQPRLGNVPAPVQSSSVTPMFPQKISSPRTSVPLGKKLDLDLYPHQHYPNFVPPYSGPGNPPPVPVLKN